MAHTANVQLVSHELSTIIMLILQRRTTKTMLQRSYRLIVNIRAIICNIIGYIILSINNEC
jgi:hypothetical protein